jgi:hypothetical protein
MDSLESLLAVLICSIALLSIISRRADIPGFELGHRLILTEAIFDQKILLLLVMVTESRVW